MSWTCIDIGREIESGRRVQATPRLKHGWVWRASQPPEPFSLHGVLQIGCSVVESSVHWWTGAFLAQTQNAKAMGGEREDRMRTQIRLPRM
jgi:hypothetical protein